MDGILPGWFSETSELWPGRALSLEITERLYSARSKYQQIDVYQTKCCGKMLALDGIIQFTESDEFAYQEMLTHLAMFAHPNPLKVLVIGGGDGGILREVARHASVREIDICEIDLEVIDVCKRFVPSMARGFDDPRVRLHVADGAAFVRERPGAYDVIIVDSTDPIGPAESLFQEPFYAAMKSALKPSGIIATQAESFFLLQQIVRGLLDIAHGLFDKWAYAYMLVPTYPGGHIGVCLASLGAELKRPARQPDPELASQLRYYTPEVHAAAFVLPAFAARMIAEIQGSG